MAHSVQKQLVVYDFDWSMADQDTDRWVFEVLAPDLRRKLKTLEPDIQWTDLMAKLLEELHGRGATRDQIESALRIMPFHPAMTRCLKRMKSDTTPETTLLCLSNANQVFIDTIMKDKGITNLFDEIITNPATWRDDGLLQVRRRVDPAGPQHSCKVGCSPNMCKGEELMAYLERKGISFDRMIYVGDGKNDFCPILRLRSQDIALVRVGRGLQERIEKEGKDAGMVAKVKLWAGAWEVEEMFPNL